MKIPWDVLGGQRGLSRLEGGRRETLSFIQNWGKSRAIQRVNLPEVKVYFGDQQKRL